MKKKTVKKTKPVVRRKEHEFSKAVGRKVKQLRESQGHRKVDLARKAAITDGCLLGIEKGDRCPTLPVAYRLARALNTTVDRLLNYPKK